MRDETGAHGRRVSGKKLDELREVALREDPDETDLAKLKEAIASGEYQPDVEGLAERMLWDGQCMDELLSR